MGEMAKDFAKAFYTSQAWEKCREAFIAERRALDGGMCQFCGERLGFIVHHVKRITPETLNDPSVTLSHDNLRYVCKECHDLEHRQEMFNGRGGEARCEFDREGKPIDRRGL